MVIHSRGDHWVVASTLVASGVVNVYVSVYSTVNKEVIFASTWCSIVGKKCVHSKAVGGQDCGSYTVKNEVCLAHFIFYSVCIAIATALAFGQNPAALNVRQVSLHSHLVNALMLKDKPLSCLDGKNHQ